MSTKPKPPISEPTDYNRLWQPPEKRAGFSAEGQKWLEENAEAIKSINDWVEKNGIPFAKYRKF